MPSAPGHRHALRHTVTIQWEPPGDQGQGVELKLGLSNGQTEVHQCRRENGTVGEWTPSSLAKVLRAAKVQLGRPDVDRFVFVSRDRAPVLADLAERSQHCNNDPSVFIETSLSSENHRRAFSRLSAIWELDPGNPSDAAEVLRLLRGLQFQVWDDSDRNSLERSATRLVKGRGRDVIASISDFLIHQIGNVLYADDLRGHLKDSGCPPLDLRPGDVAAAIERLRNEFEESLGAALIGDALIHRPETQQLRCFLADPEGPRIVFLHGSSGAGKSGALLELTKLLSQDGTAVLPLRLDIHRPEKNLDNFSADLGLPATPSICLAAFASGRPAVLVVDQLDAIRWTGALAGKAWLICKEMIERALDFPNLRVVAACRTFDLVEDQQISRWEKYARASPNYRLERVEAKELSEDVVRRVVESHGMAYDSMTPRQRRLLANAQCLYVWCSLRLREAPPRAFETQTDLLAEYWAFIRSRVTERMGVASTDLDMLVGNLVDYLDRRGRLDAPRSHVVQYKQALDALSSFGVVQQLGNTIRFTHQSYLDYLIAERVLRAASQDTEAPVEWLREQDQSLLRRQQLRQLLLLLRDREPERYASMLRGLLNDPSIRFHLKHLVLNHLRTIPVANEDERALVVEYLGRAEWRTHVLEEAVARNPAWFDVLDDEGILEFWLESPEEELRNQAGWLCRIFTEDRPDRVEGYLTKAWDSGEESMRQLVDWALPFNVEDQTESMFRWRLERVRSGAHHLEFYEIERLAKKNTLRSVQLLEAYIQHALAVCEMGMSEARERRRNIDLEGERFDPLEAACRENAIEAWDRLALLLGRALALMRKLDDEIARAVVGDDQFERRESIRSVMPILERLLCIAGASVAQVNWQNAIELIEALGCQDHETTRRVIARTMVGGPPEFADYAIDWLCAAPDRFELREYKERPADDPGRALVHKFSPHCSDACFARLEKEVIRYHTPWEMRSVRRQRDLLKERNWLILNEYGKPQSILLSAMPPQRLGEDARQRRETWERKFGRVEEYPPGVSTSGGWVGSPVHGKTKLVSDAVWLRIINKDWSDRSRHRRQAGPDRLVEASPDTFSSAMQEAAHREPSRFAKLAVRIPQTADQTYFAALIRGIAETKAPSDAVADEWEPARVGEIEKVFVHVAPIADTEVARAICWLVRGRPQEGWSAQTRELMREMARSMAEPAPVMTVTGSDSAHEDLESTSLNCLHGAVAHAIAPLMYADKGLVEEFLPTIRAMAEDDRAAVRLAAMEAIAPVYNYDRDLSAEIFVAACSHEDDRILGGRATGYLLRFLREPYAAKIRPILERMTRSEVPAAAESGAFWATVQRYTLGQDVDLADSCAAGTVHQRKGSVEALVALCESEEWRGAVQENLRRFFDDEDGGVLSKATEVFRSENILADSSVGSELALAFASSSGFERRPSRLVDWLEHWEGSLLPYADSILLSVERLSGELAGNTRDVSRPYGMVGRDTATVLLRLYGEVEELGSRELRSRCLDAWDALLKSHVGFVKEQLEKLDVQ